jgi:hypothetical protein
MVEYDMESVGALLMSLGFSLFVAFASIFACCPTSVVTLKVKKVLKKVAPKLMEQPGLVDVDSEVSLFC